MAGKRGSLRHSTTSLSESSRECRSGGNKLSNVRSFSILQSGEEKEKTGRKPAEKTKKSPGKKVSSSKKTPLVPKKTATKKPLPKKAKDPEDS